MLSEHVNSVKILSYLIVLMVNIVSYQGNLNGIIEENGPTSSTEIDMNLFDVDTHISATIMAYKVFEPTHKCK